MKRLVVLGGGESGVGTALLGKEKGFDVFVSDFGALKKVYKDVLKHNEIEWEEGKHTAYKILNADVVMKSPGISEQVPIVKALLETGIPVISEIEFAAQFTSADIIGITGSNGKTTTTMMANHILNQAKFDVVMGGNIGDSFAGLIHKDPDYFVLELSSFQLDGIKNFRPHIAVLTNITPDHLDRYANKFENYIASKFRIILNQTKQDYLIYDADDEVISTYLQTHPIQSTLVPFSLTKTLAQGTYLNEKEIIIKLIKEENIMPTTNLALEGKHNIKNAMAAATVAHLLKIRKETIRESLECFQGAEHRLEHVLKINKVQYINDSKATNVNATYFALESMSAPTVWIVGGVDKGNDYSALFPFINEKVKAIICLGKDNEALFQNFEQMVDIIVETQYMSEAVKIAYNIATAGENVLLSPACASFDLFKNYEDRGHQFKSAVRAL
ncbi:UDP-N-acetylmuramoylalanine--D-glutamate ligase [Formosa sp. Hel3_A1_48]|jgi:UDP-N-acetylmuramoylalanine--D-glutamate ligase|uniref:UDP-N-acetylmuramoyl-L-alanine--D-glutamate ligase n=1 Tax=Formosa sp. Hel3_A1_48 TaxID=1336795 RepID=UPI00084E2588|nr:UDP-N-acetylmuramoyl-L-alanine--D-glutamate ligase [Formosa sp. Hel3_A1_48]AOR25912.1 UDP-N-acetylmuramoylalanine--D-glutamate ligase [Formosa sp. Hel3_A1_48]MDC0950670.1 UDP-N-acetylmuramoyl-L-alanine--D-glutamate ligase [Flavobacteriaceae bacterium]MDG1672559.1 UDP-N-acetylmuramoyl-L-alanine--D-glutamate ligase [Flavobacteriaceae bacterium]